MMDRGLVLCAGDPWLAASPDGIIDNKLLEVNAPSHSVLAHPLMMHSLPQTKTSEWRAGSTL